MQKIIFTPDRYIAPGYEPYPAAKSIPDWYKKIPGERQGSPLRDTKNGTVKRCIPVFDAMTAGYIIPTSADVRVTMDGEYPYYAWTSTGEEIGLQDVDQAVGHPASNGLPYPKWNNPWSIRTPRGYSCLIVPPMHRENKYFTCLPAIVDTDTYSVPINFPFTMNDIKWEGIIPAGTPMVQVIPFKRDAWKSVIADVNQGEETNISIAKRKLDSIIRHSYKLQFWTRKHYE